MFRIGRDHELLGISLGERGLLVAQAAIAQVAEFIYPADIGSNDCAALGKALTDFLKTRGFTARHAVIGVPAKWLIAKPFLMPPADSETAASILWLHAAEVIPDELGPMVFDYAGQSSPSHPTHLMLIGLQQRWMQWLLALCKGAHLKPIAATPSAAAASAATALHGDHSLVLWLHPEGAELIFQERSQMRSLRHLGPPRDMLAQLRRAAAASAVPAGSLALWDDIGHDPAFLDALRDTLQLPVVEASPRWVKADGEIHKGLCTRALILAAQHGETHGANLLRPRMRPPKNTKPRRRAVWMSAAATVVAVLILALADLANLQRQISWADRQLDALRPAVEAAHKFVASTQFAASFQAKSPRCLSCIRDLTLALGQDQKTYFTSFNLAGNMAGHITGRSDDRQNIVNLMDQLNTGGHFTQLNCKLDPAGKGIHGNDVSFSVTFSYIPST